MRITVSIPVALPASGMADGVEPLVVEAGRRAMRVAVRAACREYERHVQTCVECDSEHLQSHGTDARRLRTSFGRVPLHLRRLRCEGCGGQFRPAEPFLASLDGGMVTARLREACVLAGSSWPYATAATVLRGLCGAEISKEWIRQLTNAAGRAEARQQTEAAARLLTPSMAGVRAERAVALTDPTPAPAPAHLLVGLDGGWVPSRDQPGGMERKVGVVATEAEPMGTRGGSPCPRRGAGGAADRPGRRGGVDQDASRPPLSRRDHHPGLASPRSRRPQSDPCRLARRDQAAGQAARPPRGPGAPLGRGRRGRRHRPRRPTPARCRARRGAR